jgi:hypothetical protein
MEGLIYNRTILNGLYDEVLVENLNSRDLIEVSKEKALSLLDFNLSISNNSFENETKNLALIYRVDNVDTGDSALYNFSNLKLTNSNSIFSIDISNTQIELLELIDGSENILNLNELNLSKTIEIKDNSLNFKTSEIFSNGNLYLSDGEYRVQFVLSGDFDPILNSANFDSNIFSGFSTSLQLLKSSYGFEGYLKIEKSEVDSVVAPPSTPTIPSI